MLVLNFFVDEQFQVFTNISTPHTHIIGETNLYLYKEKKKRDN
jgi:hypothetical protein